MKNTLRFGLLSFLLVLAGCGGMRPYEPPQNEAPHALLKLKFKYAEMVSGSSVGARMGIRHDAKDEDDRFESAFNESYGSVASRRGAHDIPMAAVKVHPGKKTDVTLAVYFYWYTTHTHMVMVNKIPQMQTQQIYNEKACTVQLSFTPGAGKVYLLDYNSPNVDRDCTAHAYEQVKQRGGQFKLVKVSTSKPR